MPYPVITVENLNKVYNISHQGARPGTFIIEPGTVEKNYWLDLMQALELFAFRLP